MSTAKDRIRKSEMTSAEVEEFERLDKIVGKAAKTFAETAAALYKIKDGKLYRGKYNTFDDYCQSVHQISRSYAYKLISAGKTRAELSPIVHKLGVPMPDNEAQLRELARVTNPKVREEVLVAAVEVVTKEDAGGLTARAIRDQVDARRCTKQRAAKTTDGDPPLSKTGSDIAEENVEGNVVKHATSPNPLRRSCGRPGPGMSAGDRQGSRDHRRRVARRSSGRGQRRLPPTSQQSMV